MTGSEYTALLDSIAETAAALPRERRISLLYELVDPLLDAVEDEGDEFGDDTPITTAEAVEEVRRAAAGSPVELDAVHECLVAAAVHFSEDQDPDRHVVSQTYLATAAWLRLLAGRDLREPPEAGGDPPLAFAEVADVIAWTRSGQIHVFADDAEAAPRYHDLPAAARELVAIRAALTAGAGTAGSTGPDAAAPGTAS